jgi:hypothetical protein
MAVNLLDTVKDGVPGSFAAMAGGFLGESGASTGSALTALLPVLIATLARSGAAAGGTRSVLAMLANPSVDTAILPNLNSIFAAGAAQANSMMSAGAALAASVFGERLAPLTAALGSMSGFTKPSSAQKLVALAVPITLAFLKRCVAANALSASGLASVLASQRPFVEGGLDSGLTVALGYADPAAMLSTLQPTGEDRHEVVAEAGAGAVGKTNASRRAGRSGLPQWWPWLAAAMVALYLLSRLMILHEAPGAPSPPTTPPASVPAPTPPASSTLPPATTVAPGSPTDAALAPAPMNAATPASGASGGTGTAAGAGAAKPR